MGSGTTFLHLIKTPFMEPRDGSKQNANVPETNPSKPMDSKQDVQASPDPKTEQDFPGYPHYPAKEDMMDQRSGHHRVDADLENTGGTATNTTGYSQRYGGNADDQGTPRSTQTEDDLGLQTGNDADVTSDDLIALNSTNDEIGTPQNVSTEDINTDNDIPGSELDDELEAVGEEDEENNYYSLGGDRHVANEEDPQSGPVREA